MKFSSKLLAAGAFLAVMSCTQAPARDLTFVAAPVPAATEAPAGAYKLDAAHASITYRVNHLGMSNFTGRFTTWDAELELDPLNPEAARIAVRIDPRSITSDNAPQALMDVLHGQAFLDVARFDSIAFRSTAIELTGPNTARLTGDFTMHGVTRPLTLNATFNGGYAGHAMDPNARIGFSARGTLKRSEFGMGMGIPEPGSTMGVGDDVEIIVEAEFTGPALNARS